MLGADHHGYVGRMMAMCAAFGDTPGDNLQLLIGQMVNLLQDGRATFACRSTQRAIVTMDDLVDAVGVDAARYSLERSSADTPLDIDLELLKKRTTTTPCTTCSTRTLARRLSPAMPPRLASTGLSSTHPCSTTRPNRLCWVRSPSIRESSTRPQCTESRTASPAMSKRSPSLYHRWYDARRIVPKGDDKITADHRTRLWLNDAVAVVVEERTRTPRRQRTEHDRPLEGPP